MTAIFKKLTGQALGLFRSTHPIPSLAVTFLTIMYGISYFLSFEHLTLIGLCVLAQQFSVGLSNDWLDFHRDLKVNRPDKPTARGEVSVSAVRNASFAVGFMALALASTFGWLTALIMALMLIAGWSYNLGLKSTGFSVVPYIMGFGILPVFVTVSFPEPQLPPWWVILASALLGVSAHFANALPDLLDDKQTGVRALPHLLGQRVSALIIAGTAIFASALVVTQSSTLNPVIAIAGLTLTIGISGAASALALSPKPPRVIFQLLIAASFVNVVLLVLGQSGNAQF